MIAFWFAIPSFLRWLAACLLACVLAYGFGRWDGRKVCNTAKLEAQLKAAQFDLDTQRELSDLAWSQTQKQEQRSKALNDKVAEYEKELAKRPNPACRLDDDDVRRLRDLSR